MRPEDDEVGVDRLGGIEDAGMDIVENDEGIRDNIIFAAQGWRGFLEDGQGFRALGGD
ncbi:hypothetical protein RQX22_18975 [Sphingosinicella sp. GR2756]|uniref:Uncharacterized protein n=1 Tax=Sphingosinicella rhizophila TaxID=3050082 RepID=A0ABU3QCA6_9SPHN|nr:hypothetical protein [Sphingosinicella sp. GR2756]MDT9601042.1 hypothetical protein [Sphingosinicella sp. GR2756]